MFQCGQRPENWPSREVLDTWASADILDRANEYWFWGMTCEQQLYFVGEYFKCNINNDRDACDNIKAIEERRNDTT